MYANLEVRVERTSDRVKPHRRETQDGRVTCFSAWWVKFDRGHVSIGLDGNDGEGNYAEPRGTVRLELRGRKVDVGADF